MAWKRARRWLAPGAGLLLALGAACQNASDPVGAISPSPLLALGVGISLAALVLLGIWSQFQAWRSQRATAAAPPPGAPLVAFDDLQRAGQRYTLTDEHLRRALLVTGRPGSGKTTLLSGIAAGAMRLAAADATRTIHLVCFDASRDIAKHIAWLSAQYGRKCVVVDIGNPAFATPLCVPRPGHRGAQSLAESIRDAHFPFAAEIPRQMFDALFNTFLLLDAAGYAPEQSLRLLLSGDFRRHVTSQGASRLSTHTLAWVRMIESLTPTEWHRKFSSSLARLFGILENPYTRALFAGRRGRFDFQQLVEPQPAARGYDVVITSSGTFSDEEILFAFGILFNEFSAILGGARDRPPGTREPEIVLLADEIGRYGAPGAILQLMQTARNVHLRAVFATHSLTSLHPRLQEQVVLHANRLAGGESGPGAELAAAQLAPYQFDAVAARGADGRPTAFWSPDAQRHAFLQRLTTLPDYQFALRLVDQAETVWVQPAFDLHRQPSDAERADALERAIAASGRPLAEVLAELNAEHQALDRAWGPIHYEPAGPDAADDDWRDRPADDFAPI